MAMVVIYIRVGVYAGVCVAFSSCVVFLYMVSELGALIRVCERRGKKKKLGEKPLDLGAKEKLWSTHRHQICRSES
ncbi:hypothetical protein [Escherichia coli]|uniref:hypothetical protein n=1 Tax=Escherichia coli TaxID=562 RepID=UPI002577AE4A|nr:hypothetical protein [Escherichia coli]MDM1593463.1 hypothetical protein [Escherichia coli]